MYEYLKKTFINSEIAVNKILIDDNLFICVLYMIGVSDLDVFNRFYLEKIKETIKKDEYIESNFLGIIRKIDFKNIESELYNANIVLYIKNEFYTLALSKQSQRSVSDSIADAQNMFGSRDGFIENIDQNLSLIRTRLKSNLVIVNDLCIGKISKTKVKVIAIKDIASNIRYERIIKTLNKIDIDAVLNITDITSYFSKNRIFPVDKYSGAPDEVVKNLLEGEIVILIDRIPVAVILPTSLFFATKLKIDDQTPKFYAFIQRTYVFLSFFISVFWLGLFASLVMFQSNNLSFLLLSSLKVSQRGVIFPVFYEMLGILFLFELMQLIGLRSSGVTIQNIIIIVGGILIGQNTITSGLVGVVVMTLTAFSFVSSYLVTNDSRIIMSISLMRLIVFVSSLFLGFFGVVIAGIIICSLIYKNSFLGVSFLHPFIPFDFSNVLKFFKSRNNVNYKKNKSLNSKKEVLKK